MIIFGAGCILVGVVVRIRVRGVGAVVTGAVVVALSSIHISEVKISAVVRIGDDKL